jgi:hypothetical protein
MTATFYAIGGGFANRRGQMSLISRWLAIIGRLC